MFKNNDWYYFVCSKVSCGQEMKWSDEGIQSASNLKYSGKVELIKLLIQSILH